MTRVCDKCKREVVKITKDADSSLWFCEDCLKETRKKRQAMSERPGNYRYG